MICYCYQFERDQTQEALMNNVLENVIATIIVTVLSTAAGLIFQAFGFSAQASIGAAGIVLLVLVFLFVVARRYYPIYSRWLTERLLERSLSVKPNEADAVTFKDRIVKRVLRENPLVEPNQSNSIRVYPNQDVCEPHIRDAFRDARKVKMLTIRGDKYFLGSRSLLHEICLAKQEKGVSIKVLVLSSESGHITEELAGSLGHISAERTKRKMRIALDNLKHIAEQNRNFEVKCYNEAPNFKVLLFDDIMFVSAIIGPKNDHNAKMWQITREEAPLFIGLERYFDDLWKHSVSP